MLVHMCVVSYSCRAVHVRGGGGVLLGPPTPLVDQGQPATHFGLVCVCVCVCVRVWLSSPSACVSALTEVVRVCVVGPCEGRLCAAAGAVRALVQPHLLPGELSKQPPSRRIA
jgi:hypothetical protein